MKNPFNLLLTAVILVAAILLAGCGGGSDEGASSGSEADTGPIKVTLQTDWYPQPEHGGFYQAVAEGYYADEGLDVEIIAGGPGAFTAQKIAMGNVDFSIGRSDDIIIGHGRGLPLIIVAALMQHDPQGIMVHKESGIETWKDLDGKAIMTTPGTAFIEIIERIHDIEVDIIPLDYGMDRFLANKDFIQQNFITNEPFYVAQKGANPHTLLISDGGFNPYRVIFTSKRFARQNPDIVEKFVRASIKGWNSYLSGPRDNANAIIAKENSKMKPDFMEFSVAAMKEYQLVTGDPALGEATGLITKERIQEQIDQLHEIGMIEEKPEVSDVMTTEFLPDNLEEMAREAAATFDKEQEAITAQTNPPLEIAFDIPGVDAPEGRTVPFEELLELSEPHRAMVMAFDGVTDRERDLTIVPLTKLIEHFDVPAESDIVLAECNDKYQSNYSAEFIAEKNPYLVLKIDGIPFGKVMADQGMPHLAPYCMTIDENDDLLDPGNKSPYGLTRLVFSTEEKVLQEIALTAEEQDDPKLVAGKHIYVNNCVSCHATTAGTFGGYVSDRNIMILATQAKFNRDYFMKMMMDPANTLETAERMPAHTHYSDADLTNLIAFLSAQM